MSAARFSIASLCLIAIACSAPDASKSQQDAGAHYAVAASQLKSLEPAGATAILFDARGELAEISTGYANAERGRKFDGSTRVSIGELSEIFVSALIMQEAERGELDIDAPFGRYLTADRLASGTPAERRIRESTIREMLYQGTGISANFALMLRGYDPSQNAESYLAQAPVIRESGVARIPSGALIDMLGLFAASRARSELGAYSRRSLFGPLGMRSASYGPRKRDARYATHYKYGLKMPDVEEPLAPSRSFVADSHDLVRFFRIFLSGDASGNRRVLNPDSIAEMLSSQSPSIARNQGVSVGLPWLLDPPGLSFLGEGAWYAGKYLGHRACVIIFPDRGIGALAVTNAWAWDAKETLYDSCSSFLTQYAAEALGITRPSRPSASKDPIPEELRRWLAGTYASELGPVRLDLAGETLNVTFEGETSDFLFTDDHEFISATEGEIQAISPAETGSVEVRFASGFDSPACFKLAHNAYSASWASLPGTYRRTGEDAALPYALQIRANEGLYLIAGGDGREYVIVPQAKGAGRVVCNGASPFFGKELRFVARGTIMLGSCAYGD
jgi:CubicO group peptidase (beta-lactamase class C family)